MRIGIGLGVLMMEPTKFFYYIDMPIFFELYYTLTDDRVPIHGYNSGIPYY